MSHPLADNLPTSLRTDRLALHMVDPDNEEHLELICWLYNLYRARQGDSSAPTTTHEDIQRKHRLMKPKAKLCTLTPPPRGMFHLIYLDDAQDPNDRSAGLIGNICLATRSEMPCPDIGYVVLKEYEGKGYAFEAARAGLDFWRNSVGVKNIFIGTVEGNLRSQKLAERLGFVQAGSLVFSIGSSPNEKLQEGIAFVLPRMEWQDGHVIKLDISTGAATPIELEP